MKELTRSNTNRQRISPSTDANMLQPLHRSRQNARQQMLQLPVELGEIARALAEDNAILFLSANVTLDDSVPPLVTRIADALSTKLSHLPGNADLAMVAFEYETRYGRAALQNSVRDIVAQDAIQPTALHRLIADLLPSSGKVITTHFDHLLEDELDRLGKPYTLLVNDTDLANYDSQRITLVKLHGDIFQPSTLRLTAADIDQFLLVSSLLHEQVSAWFTTKGLVCLGNDLAMPSFRRFFSKATEKLGRLKQQTTVFSQQPFAPIDKLYWEKQAIQLFTCDLSHLLLALTERVKGNSAEQLTILPAPAEESFLSLSTPYKGINSYEQNDAVIFAGRSRESWILTNRILAHPREIVVVSGESGSGKSSLVKAGVAPLLMKAGAVFALCTPSPQQSLLESLQRSLHQELVRSQLLKVASSSSLIEMLRQLYQKLGKPIVLGIDQFEQIFADTDFAARRLQLRTLYDLQQNQEMDVRLLLIVRDDYVGRLQELETTLPRLLDVRFYLERLGRESAYSAIVEPAEAFAVSWEPLLVQNLLDELFEDQQGVIAPQMQIICETLYNEANKPESVQQGVYTITCELYQRLGGASAILKSYLESAIVKVLEALADSIDEQVQGELRPSVELLLNALISTTDIKQRLDFDTLARTVLLPTELVGKILTMLTRERVLQCYELFTNAGVRLEYELTHDALIPLVKRFLGDKFWQMQKVREILRQTIADWRKPTMHLLALDDLRLIECQLLTMRFAPDEQEMIFASATTLLESVAHWQALLEPERQCTVLIRLTGDDESAGHTEALVRQKAVIALRQFTKDRKALSAIARRLKLDPDPQVRHEATVSLACFAQDNLAWILPTVAELQMSAQSGDRSAQRLMAILCDLAPEIRIYLSKELFRSVVGQVLGMRWSRHRSTIQAAVLRGFFGGFCGAGLGFGVLVAVNRQATAAIDPARLSQLLLGGILLLGIMGGAAAAMATFTEANLRFLVQPKPGWLSALGGTLIGMLLLSAAFWSQHWGMSGLLLGLLWIGTAFATQTLAPSLRLYIAMGVGAAGAMLCQQFGLFAANVQPILWALLIGSIGGLGFATGIARQSVLH